ncbi:hypothetical protein D3C84_449540 [compost metagenome]
MHQCGRGGFPHWQSAIEAVKGLANGSLVASFGDVTHGRDLNKFDIEVRDGMDWMMTGRTSVEVEVPSACIDSERVLTGLGGSALHRSSYETAAIN